MQAWGKDQKVGLVSFIFNLIFQFLELVRPSHTQTRSCPVLSEHLITWKNIACSTCICLFVAEPVAIDGRSSRRIDQGIGYGIDC